MDKTTTSPTETSATATSTQKQAAPVFTELSPKPGRRVDPLLEVPREERTPHQTRPWVLTNMISSLDGATALEGFSGGLGGPSDRLMFRGLRCSADAIIVGAKTATTEQYRRPQANHQGEIPLLVIVSSRLRLPRDLPAFVPPHQQLSQPPLLATSASAPSSHHQRLDPLAEIVQFGSERVDLDLLLQNLRARGINRVLLEGGPELNGQFIAEGLVDEWNLTISPVLVSGQSSRSAHGPDAAELPQLSLKRLWQSQDVLFGRWVRDPG